MKRKKLVTLFVAPEIIPYAATGGLADVAEALPRELINEGVKTIRVMPKFKEIEDRFPLKKAFSFIVEAGRKANVADIYKLNEDGIITYFVGNDKYFNREQVYGYHDDDERFGFFCKATLEMLIFLNIKPDIIHLNDWQTALIGLFLKEEYSELNFYKDIKVVYTIHNLQYQGVFEIDALKNLNLSTRYFNKEAIEYYGKVCYMKAGIVYADLVTTVSKTYSKEIQTVQYGYGLDGLLRKYNWKIKGILNGIYYDKYNPNSDNSLVENFSVADFSMKRKINRLALQKEVGLPERDVPVFGVVTRLAEQKGVDLILHAIRELIDRDIQFVILGSGEPYYEDELISLSEKYNDKIKIVIEFNQKLARRIYGSADMFLMPSLFEPCGLSQLYSLRYGAVPIVRGTGGLLDTIIDYNGDQENGTGFVFNHYNGEEFVGSIIEALELYEEADKWKILVKRCMEQRFSWNTSAKEYIVEYNSLVNRN